MSTTAMAKLYGIDKATDGETVTLFFNADYDDERNKEWAKYTPSLHVQIVVTAEVAEKQFGVDRKHAGPLPLGASFEVMFTRKEG